LARTVWPRTGILRVVVALELLLQAVLLSTHTFEGAVLWHVRAGHGLTVGDVSAARVVAFARVRLVAAGRDYWERRAPNRSH
jgi:hypothetical protein